MIGLSRQTDYAARLVLHLAALPEGSQVPIAGIAQQRELPVPFVRRLVARLVTSGILKTTRGSAGGVKLGRPAGEISLLDLVQTMEGGITLNPCLGDHAHCPFADACPVRVAWAGAGEALATYLAGVTFETLAATNGHARAHRIAQSTPLS